MRAICTSASLQASTWVSPGFTLFRHSSPPFGSKQAHSNSTPEGRSVLGIRVVCTPLALLPPFQYERWYLYKILSLARLFDSLVRVSRRVEAPHFQRQVLSITTKCKLAATRGVYSRITGFPHFSAARFTGTPVLHLLPPRSPRVQVG